MKPQDTPTSDDRSNQAPTRKAYQKPRLQVYGDLAEITNNISGSKTNDGAGHPNKHFTS
jgi:hypothetical protein